jgi:hypothetical protein
MDPIQYLSVADLAAESRESMSVWRKRVFRREIPYVKLGRNVRVRRGDFDAFIAARVVKTEAGR